jgi:long-chain acyl-CoA synthetase
VSEPSGGREAPNTAVGAGRPDTMPTYLLRNAISYADRPAYREKALGIWQTWTWAETLKEVEALALGLHRLGLTKGQTVAIVGDNRPRLYWAFAAVQSLGAIPVPMYQDSVAREMAYVLSHAEVRLAIVENQEQVDKLLSIASDVPSLAHIVYDDERGLDKYDKSNLTSFASVQADGRRAIDSDPLLATQWRETIASISADDVSVMLYTSGTTGQPKGVMLTHANIARSAENGNAFDKFTADDEVLAYLPMAWVGDHIFSYGQALAAGMCVHCPESPDTIQEDRREVAPTYFFAPPRVFETLLTQITVRMQDAGPVMRKVFEHFLGVARKSGERILNGEPVSFGERLHYKIGDLVVYGPLRNRMGFSRLRVAYTAGEAIGPELFSFFRSLGINLKQLYGQTEASVYVTLQPDGQVFSESVGTPGPGVELRIADNGEVLFKSPGVFKEYYKNPEATAATKTTDGWVHTGDAGFIDNRGHLRIIDRAKDVGRLAGGALFAPKYVENRIKFFPEIKEAVVFGDQRDYATAFINIDLASVGNWAERNNVVYASYQELAQHPDVYKMIERRIDETNKALAGEPMVAGCQIRRFLILHKELDADDGELTRTQKVRRGFIADRYAPLITALYDGSREADIATEVMFEDGRKGVLEGHVRIIDLAAHPAAAAADAGAMKEAAE